RKHRIEPELASRDSAYRCRADRKGQIDKIVIPAGTVGRRQVKDWQIATPDSEPDGRQSSFTHIVDMNEIRPTVTAHAQVSETAREQPAADAPDPKLTVGPENATRPQDDGL